MNKSKKTTKRAGATKKRTKAKQGRKFIIEFGKKGVTHYEKDELHDAIDRAIEKAYKHKGRTKVADPDEIKKNVKEVFELFSRRKRGPRFNPVITKATDIFLEELEKAGISLTRFKLNSTKERNAFWNDRIWATRQVEIIEAKIIQGATDWKGRERLAEERERIRDRVMRELRNGKRQRKRINYRAK